MKNIIIPSPENITNPFNKKHIEELNEMSVERGMKCANCDSEEVSLKQFSPDLGRLYFCKEKCHKEFQKGNLYRALEVEPITPTK